MAETLARIHSEIVREWDPAAMPPFDRLSETDKEDYYRNAFVWVHALLRLGATSSQKDAFEDAAGPAD